jgi:hypothetical protein
MINLKLCLNKVSKLKDNFFSKDLPVW